MPANPRLVYWDACVFIDYVQKNPARVGMLDAIVEEARQGKIKIVTSTLSITEVAFGESERDPGPLDPTKLKAIDEMWLDRSIISLTEYHLGIAEEARSVLRHAFGEKRRISSADAIHLATAINRGVGEFHTYDVDLLGWDGVWFPVREPVAQQLLLPNPESS